VHLELSGKLLIATFKKGIRIDVGIARKIVDCRKRFTKNRTYPVLILNKGVISMTREAREYFASDEGTAGLRASALVLRTSFGAVMGNIFLKVNKPRMPVKIFSTEKGASKWLKQYVA
jgi:hypothetical protein